MLGAGRRAIRLPPMPRTANPGAEHRPGFPRRTNPRRGAELRASERPVGAAPSPRLGAGCCASLHRFPSAGGGSPGAAIGTRGPSPSGRRPAGRRASLAAPRTRSCSRLAPGYRERDHPASRRPVQPIAGLSEWSDSTAGPERRGDPCSRGAGPRSGRAQGVVVGPPRSCCPSVPQGVVVGPPRFPLEPSPGRAQGVVVGPPRPVLFTLCSRLPRARPPRLSPARTAYRRPK